MKNIVTKILDEDKLSERIGIILQNWSEIDDHKGALSAALYVSNRELTQEEKDFVKHFFP